VQPVAESGGSDQALLRLVRQLTGAGWQCHVALPGPSPMAAGFAAAGATLHTVPMRRISTSHGLLEWAAYLVAWPLSVLRLWRLARHVRAQVVHSNSLHSWYGWAVALLARRPHVWHAREIVTQSRLALGVERFLARHFAARVLAVSAAVAAQLWPGNVEVVAEEVDASEYCPARAGRARARVGIADDAVVVGYVARIDTWKGVDVLLSATPTLQAARTGAGAVKVVVAGAAVSGKEAYARSLEDRAATLGACWLGPLSGPDAADLIADLDCLVLPSTGPEPWGLVLVEALACGTPVVATDAGGPREILAGLPSPAGRLVPAGDPAALATAVAELLPAGSSTQLRRARPVLRTGTPPPYPAIFASVASASRG
jgi:glycosyltransferase involved in cell wall biosynthesis